MGALPGDALIRAACKHTAIVSLKIEKKISSEAVEFVGNARALSKDLWATREDCPSGPAKSTALEARGYVGNPKGCPSPVVNPLGFSTGRHIHQPVCAVDLSSRKLFTGFIAGEK
jgi:hypothetical protein